jgi:hypothetical protein
VRYLYFFFFGAKTGGHVQSLLLGVVFAIMGFMMIVVGLLADIIAANRRLNEEILYRQKKGQFKK